MPRRLKLFFVGVLAFTVAMLVYTSHMREAQPRDPRTLQDFYHKTKGAWDSHGSGGGSGGGSGSGSSSASEKANTANANKDMSNAKTPIVTDLDADGDVDEEDARLARAMQDRLKAAEQQAKDRANAKSPNKPDAPSEVIGVGSSASGQKKGGPAPAGGVAAAGEGDKDTAGSSSNSGSSGTPEEAEAMAELEQILKRAPVIVFSKSYCPYSKRAKGLLLDKYVVEPAPYVVELDTHPLGAALQAHLATLTGRRTVPNILVSGKSIGGSDELAALDADKLLVDKVKSLAGTRVEMKERLA
ncbi:glutaredoxin domain containing protein [Niveomyces insectorum RCEF 264]|uniref:Glutaredoxin domain containing protein n=1 Tax=Niveomyces insectorum RCEF 264 TaxID=1081102 RepID=A0A167XVM1_9HYPO|nr:glutaredoxin domain containing protein [Niveomyces insectorum RCEF 264]